MHDLAFSEIPVGDLPQATSGLSATPGLLRAFRLGNGLVERTLGLFPDGFRTLSFRLLPDGPDLAPPGGTLSGWPDAGYQGLTWNPWTPDRHLHLDLVHLEVEHFPEAPGRTASLTVAFHLEAPLHGLHLVRRYRILAGAPALSASLSIRSDVLPIGEFYPADRINWIEALPRVLRPADLSIHSFRTRTDHHDDLATVASADAFPGGVLQGNLLMGYSDEAGFWILKESPCFMDQRGECPGDFLLRPEAGLVVLGTGLRPEEVRPEPPWTSPWVTVGLFEGDADFGFRSLKRYQERAFPLVPERDLILMANPWGDRRLPDALDEALVLRELEACADLGLTHYLLDDGWQAGGSFRPMNRNQVLPEAYWAIHPVRFPNGFSRIAREARRLGISLGLWFAPDFTTGYRTIRRDYEVLRERILGDGFRYVKLDGMKLRTRDCVERLEWLMGALREAAGDPLVFLLDVTADPRFGYFQHLEQGSLFLENRYTDWGTYRPHRTFRNLWSLSPYVPAWKIQAEFLNLHRNGDRYGADDPLRPAAWSHEAVFATVLLFSPLAWCEVSALPDEARQALRPMIRLYRDYAERFARCRILPVGEAPSGHAWTGLYAEAPFQDEDYLLVVREETDAEACSLALPSFARPVPGAGRRLAGAGEAVVTPDGRVRVSIPSRKGYGLFALAIVPGGRP